MVFEKGLMKNFLVILFCLVFPPVVSAQECGPMACVQEIRFVEGKIFIEFNLDCPMFQVVGRVGMKGAFEPLPRQSSYELRLGEIIQWGDGDHAFQSLTFKVVQDRGAVVIFKDKFRWPTAPTKECTSELILKEEKKK